MDNFVNIYIVLKLRMPDLWLTPSGSFIKIEGFNDASNLGLLSWFF